jgi:hypothetical protein
MEIAAATPSNATVSALLDMQNLDRRGVNKAR